MINKIVAILIVSTFLVGCGTIETTGGKKKVVDGAAWYLYEHTDTTTRLEAATSRTAAELELKISPTGEVDMKVRATGPEITKTLIDGVLK